MIFTSIIIGNIEPVILNFTTDKRKTNNPIKRSNFPFLKILPSAFFSILGIKLRILAPKLLGFQHSSKTIKNPYYDRPTIKPTGSNKVSPFENHTSSWSIERSKNDQLKFKR
jgi:hypothetical protein